jgi:uncharacterized membrane protein
MRRILLVLAVALVMAAMAAPSAVADHRAQHQPAESSEWCYGGVPESSPGSNCFNSLAACEDAREAFEGTTPCEHEVVR